MHSFISMRWLDRPSIYLSKNWNNKTGYTAVRCVPLVISLLSPSLVTAFPAPSSFPIPSSRHPQPLATSEADKTHFRAFKNEKKVTDGPMAKQTDTPSYEDDGRI